MKDIANRHVCAAGRARTRRCAQACAMLTKSECLRREAAPKARAFRSDAESPQGEGSA